MMRVLLLVLAPAVASGFHAARILRKPQPSGLGATSTPEPPTRGVFHYDFHCDVTLTPPLLVLMPDGTCTIRVNGTLKMEGRGDVKGRTRWWRNWARKLRLVLSWFLGVRLSRGAGHC